VASPFFLHFFLSFFFSIKVIFDSISVARMGAMVMVSCIMEDFCYEVRQEDKIGHGWTRPGDEKICWAGTNDWDDERLEGCIPRPFGRNFSFVVVM
jgi:hypothetical protein